MRTFSELTTAQQREARFIFSALYSFDRFLYSIDDKGHVVERFPLKG